MLTPIRTEPTAPAAVGRGAAARAHGVSVLVCDDLAPIFHTEDAQRGLQHRIAVPGRVRAQRACQGVVQNEVQLLLLPVLPHPRKVAAEGQRRRQPGGRKAQRTQAPPAAVRAACGRDIGHRAAVAGVMMWQEEASDIRAIHRKTKSVRAMILQRSTVHASDQALVPSHCESQSVQR